MFARHSLAFPTVTVIATHVKWAGTLVIFEQCFSRSRVTRHYYRSTKNASWRRDTYTHQMSCRRSPSRFANLTEVLTNRSSRCLYGPFSWIIGCVPKFTISIENRDQTCLPWWSTSTARGQAPGATNECWTEELLSCNETRDKDSCVNHDPVSMK